MTVCGGCLGRGWVLDYTAESPHLAPHLDCKSCGGSGEVELDKPDMSNEDELTRALLSVAKEIGQCQKIVSGQQCMMVAGHPAPCYIEPIR